MCSFAHTPSNAHPAAQTTRLDTVKNSPPLLYLLLTGSFVRSFILPKRVPSIRPAGTTRQGKSHVARIGESQARKKTQACSVLPVSAGKLRAYFTHHIPGGEGQGLRAVWLLRTHFVRHPQLAHAHRETHSTSDRTGTDLSIPIVRSPLDLTSRQRSPKGTRLPSDNHDSSAVPIRHPSRPVTSSPPRPASPSRTVLPCLVLLLYKETFPQPHTQLGTCYRTTVLRVD